MLSRPQVGAQCIEWTSWITFLKAFEARRGERFGHVAHVLTSSRECGHGLHVELYQIVETGRELNSICVRMRGRA